MKRVLIANRGEIAKRIAQSAADLGLGTVGVFAPEDGELAKGYGCDALVSLPGQGPAAYLSAEAFVSLAEEHAADAIAPGYGFLSESAKLARACEAAGLVFVGPNAETLALLGDKARARSLAESLGIPVLSGTGPNATPDDLRALLENAQAEPGADTKGRRETAAIVLKATAGGGGRGMRVVRAPEDIDDAYVRCQSEAERAFGSGSLFGERYLERARHIEVQVLGDAQGAVAHLGDRDCSVQRRHQKLIEIAPAPHLEASLREQIAAAACALTKAAQYTGIGTIEFLVTPAGDYFFLEANPRIQVEHPVTEETMDVDLVETSLRLARGETLEQLQLTGTRAPRGFAIECRLLAERMNEAGETQPSPEVLTRFDAPTGSGVRIDTATRPGLGSHPAFDPLLAKIIVSSPRSDFRSAVARTRRALSDLRVEGPATNLALLRAILMRPEFEAGECETRFFGDERASLLAAATETETAARGAAKSAQTVASGRSGAPLKGTDLAPPSGQEAVPSPLIGTVLEVLVDEGDAVTQGQTLCVLESMKMEHVVRAPVTGAVQRRFAQSGDVVAEHAALFWIEPAADNASQGDPGAREKADPDWIRPDLEEARARLALLQDASRPEAVERRRARGQRTARENLRDLCDADSFVEYGGLAVAAMRSTRSIEDLERRTPADAIITGIATVGAERFGDSAARCAVLAADATVLAGTQGFYHHRKIDRILEVAERAGCPVVFLPEGGGGRPSDSDVGDLMTAGLNVTSFLAFARLAGKVPRVSVVSGFCFAGSAAFAGCADVIIATRDANLGMGGPAMIEGGGLGVFTPQEIGPSEIQEPNGVIDVLVEDEAEAIDVAKRYLGYFQGDHADWEVADQRELRHLIPENRRRVYDIRQVIDTLCDVGTVLELRPSFGVGMITALVRIEGRAFGLLANDPMHLGGAIDDVGSEKAARFLQLCDAFGLPVLSLCDTPGFMVGPDIEARAQVRKVSRLFVVGASLQVPLLTVILRKGYGLGAQAMAGGSFVAPALTVAWPTGEIGGMGLEGAVDLGFKKSLDEQPTPEAREALRNKLINALYTKGKALAAASQLEFDGVIDPAETRATVLRALNTFGPLGRGTRRMVDTW